MAGPRQENIDLFMSITGAPESVAIERLQAHEGDVNGAVNFYFNEREHPGPPPPHDTTAHPVPMEEDDPVLSAFSTHPSSTFPLPALRGSFNEDPFHMHVPPPRSTRIIPIQSDDEQDHMGNSHPGNSVSSPVPVDSSDTSHAHTSDTRGTGLEEGPFPSTTQIPQYDHRPSAPVVDNEDGNDIEEQMIRAAIEASKKEAEANSDLTGPGSVNQSTSGLEDDDFARAVSLSLKTAEHEKALRELLLPEGMIGSSSHGSKVPPETGRVPDQQLSEDGEEQPLIRHRSTKNPAITSEATADQNADVESAPSSSDPRSVGSMLPQIGDHLHEWGGISSQEHDEAVMLEAAIFGGVPESYRRLIPIPRPPSPKLEAERLLREQQDDEYQASLQADIEKAEARRREEEAAREAAAAEQKRLQEEAVRKRQEEEEVEHQLQLKKASLPPEPPIEDENAVTLLVRMPDGSRRGRRFLKSHRLQALFDFIDVGGGVRPGAYRLVRQYPRRAFTDKDHEATFSDLGLTSKQEALFLELI